MNQQEEIGNRWYRVFEHTEADKRIVEIDKIKISIAEDVWFLLNRVKELEQALADAANPLGGRYGALTHIENGDMMYQLHGVFIRVTTLKEILDYHLRNQPTEGFSPETKKELAAILSLVSDV